MFVQDCAGHGAHGLTNLPSKPMRFAALIFPYETSLGAGKPIFWGFFDSPADAIAGKWLDRAVHDFARCCRASSIVDQTAYPSDRLRMRWLKFRSWALCFRGRFPGGTKLICAKPSWGRRIIAGIFVVLPTVTALLNLPSMVATLSDYTVPRLWALLHDGRAVDSAPPSESEVSGSVASPAANRWHPFDHARYVERLLRRLVGSHSTQNRA